MARLRNTCVAMQGDPANMGPFHYPVVYLSQQHSLLLLNLPRDLYPSLWLLGVAAE
jgi:hypothetical protein